MVLIHKNPHATASGFSSHLSSQEALVLLDTFLGTIVNKILKQAPVFSSWTLNPEMLDWIWKHNPKRFTLILLVDSLMWASMSVGTLFL